MMRTVLSTLAGVVAAIFMSASPTSAQTLDERVYFTFTSPVAVPGAVLPAGDYVFRLADPNSGRKAIQVLSADMKKVHAMFFANEMLRAQEARTHEVALGEAPAGSPRPVDGLWAPGSAYGRGFIYGSSKTPWNQPASSSAAN